MNFSEGGRNVKLQKLYSYLRQAVEDYDMLQDGDKIAIGISGGKDSLTLLYGMAGLQKFYPKKFSILAITVDLGYHSFDVSEEKVMIDCYMETVGYGMNEHKEPMVRAVVTTYNDKK